MFFKLTDQEIIRRKKLQELSEQNKSPFLINKVKNNTLISKIVQDYSSFTREELEKINQEFSCAGRVLLIRQTFFVLSEEHNYLQAYINIKTSGEEIFNYFKKYLDIGDLVFVTGNLFFTQKNELTINVKKIEIISKCLRPLPEKHTGIKDPELLIRERVATLITNKNSFSNFIIRSQIISEIRRFLHNLEYLEFETPMLQKIAGGAAAKPFCTHYNALKENVYLRIAPELALKKLITAGYLKVFEIGKSFRNEGIDSTHNPEFTSLEIYTAYFGAEESMELTESIFKNVAKALKKDIFLWQDNEIDLSKPFAKKTISELVKEKTGFDFYSENITLDEAIKITEKHSIFLQEHEKTIGHILHKLFEELVEKTLIQPTFVYGYHKDVSPLAKTDEKNSEFTQRFELFIGGKEFANGFAELNDPIDQLERFKKQAEEKNIGNEEVPDVDYEYVRNIEYGFPPTGGIGIGIDRLIMLFTCQPSIKEVILFPHVKN